MAKTRLAKWSREEILGHIEKGIQAPKEQKVYDRTLKSAHTVILKAVHKKYPIEEMEVLKKYGKTNFDPCGTVISPSGQVIGFTLPYKKDASTNWTAKPINDMELPRVPSGIRCQILRFSVSQSDAQKVENWNLAKETLAAAKARKLEDYRALVFGSRYVEDLEAVLPFDTDFFDKYKKSTTSLTVSGELIDRIKSDALVFTSPAEASVG